ncbi:2,4-dienoyl-CoA reductase [Abditibacterium utsteinense]|uniref:2,4-dienoyl-CoA reductase n=1 Tax=Abditibacterium utsteinense TaxID=1960156 RepID=A0A2S8SWX3_9BACT|nr:alkene reductase [Abditibacterium utsteinense]PQV65302.1 2,4-dienoyl-CoA reductase [Abditibacterium utsteinense]
MTPTLFTPLTLGALELPNRVIMAPLTRARAVDTDAPDDRVPNDLMRQYYVQRASAGLIFTEATSISPIAVGYANTPGIWSSAQVAGWRKIVDAVHQAGGRIVMQLWHVGRISHSSFLGGELPVAPSAIAAQGHVSLIRPQVNYQTPRALSVEEIRETVEDYRRAALNAKEAGFDGVEIHAANGYLLDQFLRDKSNVRTDEYGGSLENRARLLLEVVDAAASVWGKDRVGVHLSPRNEENHSLEDSDPAATFTYVAQELGKRGIAFLFVRESQAEPRIAPAMKRAFGGPLIANQQLDKATAEKLLQSGEADAVSWGTQFIANPDLPRRLELDAPLNAPAPSTFYVSGPNGYIDYPFLGEK